MGQTVSSIKESVQQSVEKEKQANDAINSLQTLARATSDSYYKQILSSRIDSALIPINMVIDSASLIKCGVSEEPGPIAEEVKEMFSDFANGEVGDGIAKVLSSGLKILFGQYSANSSESTKYTIACGDLGGVYRLDMHMFSYQYTSEQLTAITRNVLAVTVVMSSIDTRKIDDNTLRIIVQKCYAACDKTEREAIYAQIKRNIDADSNANASPPLHALRRSFQLGAARSSGRLPALRACDPSGVVTENFSALVLLTFDIGAAAASAATIKGYVTGALTCAFRAGLQVTTSPMENDIGDLFLILSVVAVRWVVAADTRRNAPEKHADTLLFNRLDACLHELVDTDLPVVELRAYRFILGREDDTPRESSLVRLAWPHLAGKRGGAAKVAVGREGCDGGARVGAGLGRRAIRVEA